MLLPHAAASSWPMIEPAEFEELKKDIQARGQIQKIVLFEGKILDGRNRYKACQELGIEPQIETYTGTTPYLHVWGLNDKRRHISKEQRAAIFVKDMPNLEAELKAIEDAVEAKANAKRAEAAKAGLVGRAAAKTQASLVVPQIEGALNPPPPFISAPLLVPPPLPPLPPTPRERPTVEALSKLAGTNRPAIERQEHLRKHSPELADKVAAGEIRPTEAMRQLKKAQVHKVAPLTGKYRVIYADPPWKYNDKMEIASAAGGEGYGPADTHYPTMAISELCALSVADIAEDDAVLFLWTTSPLLENTFDIIKAWGFKYKTSFIWDKIKHNMGHYNSVRHELLLVCTRGSCTPDVGKLFDSVQSIERAEHSVKPQEFRTIIETLYTHGNKIELFARCKTEGWDAWGNQS